MRTDRLAGRRRWSGVLRSHSAAFSYHDAIDKELPCASPEEPPAGAFAPTSIEPRAPFGQRRTRHGGRLSRRAVLAVGLCVLALPAQAAAHGRGATIALDYRLSFDQATRALPGIAVRVLDGDRDFQLSVQPGVSLLVLGQLREPFLRIDAGGVWANASSPTATSDGVVSAAKRGWVRLSSGRVVIWHDHRLAPPPTGTAGPDGRFSVPIVLSGRRAAISGSFFRVARPRTWPWIAAGLALLAAVAVVVRSHRLRARLTIGLGVSGGLAALAAVTTFAVRDAPTGGVAWLQVSTGLGLALVLGVLLARLRGRSRVRAAGAVGAIGAVVSASSLSVFWHGVVISALPALLARLVCGLALVCGAAGAVLSFLPDFDEPLQVARR